MESTQAHPGPYVDDYDGAADDFNPSRDDFDPSDDYDDRPGVDRIDAIDADDDEDVEPLSPGREWLLMGAQVGAGAIAGAAVFLAFSWLWGFQPIVAVLAALVVIVGLVFGVRRWRRADDLQTTALAILAGLVVTVSPAALLLVRR
jgi:fatty acid desaturase